MPGLPGKGSTDLQQPASPEGPSLVDGNGAPPKHGDGKAAAAPVPTDMGDEGQLDPNTMVLLRFECMSNRHLKLTLACFYGLLSVSLLALIAILIIKGTLKDRDQDFVKSTSYSKGSLVLASICLAALLTTWPWGLHRIHSARASRKPWGRRRRRLVAIAMIQVSLQLINAIFWAVPQAYLLTVTCGFFGHLINVAALIRWTCWNALFLLVLISVHNTSPWFVKGKELAPVRPDPLILDAPLTVHWPKLLIWVPFQASIIFEIIALNTHPPRVYKCIPDTVQLRRDCEKPLHSRIVAWVWGGFSLLYLLVFLALIVLIGTRLRKLPYNRFRVGNLLFQWQKRQGTWLMGTMVLSICLGYWVASSSCAGFFTTWLGDFPMEIAATAAVVTTAIVMYPVSTHPARGLVVQAWLQGLAWAERTREADLAARNARLSGRVEDVQRQPMFCFETALKLLAFSHMVYREQPAAKIAVPDLAEKLLLLPKAGSAELGMPKDAGKSPSMVGDIEMGLSEREAAAAKDVQPAREAAAVQACDDAELLKLALDLSDIPQDSYHLIHDADPDIKENRLACAARASLLCGLLSQALLAWRDDAIIITFRGTASMKNVVQDLQAWQATHPPRRGRLLFGTRPRVHRGFLAAWRDHGVADSVLAFVGQLLQQSATPAQNMRVYITGHSLGGALATLAAYDLQKRFSFNHLQVYTFGAPRTGNHAFQTDYETVVPNTWHVINDADIVPKAGKFGCLYKRPGQRVILDRQGNLVVRPSPLELNLCPAGRSVKQHYLASYHAALAAVLRAQFNPARHLECGAAGALAVVENPLVDAYVRKAGVDVRALAAEGEYEVRAGAESFTSQESSGRVGTRGWLHWWGRATVDELLPGIGDSTAVLAMRAQTHGDTAVDGSGSAPLEKPRS